MQNYFKKLSFSLLTLTSIFIISCQKKVGTSQDGLPVIINTNITTASHTKATLVYEISSDGGNAITENGISYSTTTNPTIADNKVKSNNNNLGKDTISLSGLTAGTQYYARTYATNIMGTSYGAQVTFTTTTIKIGDNYAGGVVFYLDASGIHGLTSATAGLNQSGTWGCTGVSVTGTNTAIGSGLQNTTAIVTKCSTAGIAARICKTLIYNGYSDWFLPSKDELAEMLKHRTEIGFNDATRWSSSESDSNMAWAQSFDPANPVQVPISKDSVLGVRAIRAF